MWDPGSLGSVHTTRVKRTNLLLTWLPGLPLSSPLHIPWLWELPTVYRTHVFLASVSALLKQSIHCHPSFILGWSLQLPQNQFKYSSFGNLPSHPVYTLRSERCIHRENSCLLHRSIYFSFSHHTKLTHEGKTMKARKWTTFKVKAEGKNQKTWHQELRMVTKLSLLPQNTLAENDPCRGFLV